MNKTLSIPLLLLAFLALGVFAYLTVLPKFASASAPSGSPTNNATTTPLLATAVTPLLAIATSTSCNSRIISTTASPIMLTMGDQAGLRPNGSTGYIQAASTTVAYDGGLFGCGAVFVFSFTTATITVSDMR